jgi:hypothetical protein
VSVAKASFKCDQDILDDFRRLVAQKYGKLWGVLNKEFTAALKDRMEKLAKELNEKEELKESAVGNSDSDHS